MNHLKYILSCFCFVSIIGAALSQSKSLPSACRLIEKSDIINIFQADEPSLEIIRDDRNERSNRKKCVITWDNEFSSSSVFVQIKTNNKKDEYPQRYSEDLLHYMKEGISIRSDSKQKLRFETLDSLSNTIYSDNLGNDKALIIQKNNDYIISVHYQEHIDRNVGDFSDKLNKLGSLLMEKLEKQ